MMDYTNYQVEDFLTDESFVAWVRHPTPGQAAFWNEWLQAHPEQRQHAEAAREIILSVRYRNVYKPAAGDQDDVWEKISRQRVKRRKWYPLLRSVSSKLPVRYAAAALFVLCMAWFFRTQYREKATALVTLTESLAPQVFRTAKGERKWIALPDGSRVKLNTESEVRYAAGLQGKPREVVLDGEAFFEVKPDRQHPFRVTARGVTTTVLGTSFNISAYAEQKEVAVSVRTGKVGVAIREGTGRPQEVVLLPLQASYYNETTGKLHTGIADSLAAFGWKDNLIGFRNAGYDEIRKTLEKGYPVTFITEKGLEVREEFTATFRDAPLGEILEALNYTSRFRYRLVKDKVYVTRKDEN